MSACLHIASGQLVDPANGIDAPADVFLRGGKAAGIGMRMFTMVTMVTRIGGAECA